MKSLISAGVEEVYAASFWSTFLAVVTPSSAKLFATYTIDDMAQTLGLTSDDVKNYFEYLEELELVSVREYK